MKSWKRNRGACESDAGTDDPMNVQYTGARRLEDMHQLRHREASSDRSNERCMGLSRCFVIE